MKILETKRLTLREFTIDDAPFISELLNSPGWLNNIGSRNIAGLNEAGKYIIEVKKDKPLQEKTKEGIKINFPVGATEVLIKGEIEGAGDNKTYLMDVSKGQKLTGSVEAVSEAGKEQGNIRFSQIISPSGNADGPFGPSITYDLTEAGTWKLVVSENNMLGEPWKGEFKMTIGIK